MKALLYVCQGVLTLVGIAASVALVAFLFVPAGALVAALAHLVGFELGLLQATLGVMVVSCAAGLVVIGAQEHDDDGDGGGRGPEEPPSPRTTPGVSRRRDVPISQGLAAIVRGDTDVLLDMQTLAVNARLPWFRNGCDETMTVLADLIPPSASSSVCAFEVDGEPVLLLIARGDSVVERATLAHHALVTGAPISIVSSN